MKWIKLIAGVCVVLSGMMSGCSLKKNTAMSRNYTAFITRYNIYFNGDEHYKENLKDMEDKYQDDFTRMLYMHPAEARNDEKAPQPSQDFKRSIEKGQKAIQLRSIKKRPARKSGKGNDPEYKKWLKREEYNPFLHNAWMMMARSQYLNGDFLGAASTFFYISKHFWWLPNTVTEAKLWQARCYCAIDWLFEAESILVRIPEKDLTDNTLRELYYFSYADLYLRSKDYEATVPMLLKTIDYAKGAQKTRLTFLLGQVYMQLGRNKEAYDAFKSVGGMSGTNYRTRFNARIKQSEVFQGDDIKSEVNALQRLAKFGTNKEFLDQIYYAIGNLYLSRGDTVQAVTEYKKAISLSTRNGIDKAMAQLTLGGVYYDLHEYDKAQPCYAEAIPLIPDNYPDYTKLKQRSDVLDEMAVYSQNVALQDSLLRLSLMTP
ncbi:MAG: tetratricopeptide repeat protein, partial [Paramuribaculum sp.]|nr:tetratricopeptide repeat protein [Paramuribaculum sp.]